MPITDLILVTTTDMASDRMAELRRLLASVERFQTNRPDVRLHHHILLQRCRDPACAREAIGLPKALILTSIDRQVPLSVARNLMLDAVLAQPLSQATVVAFPDDDAWYPAGTMEHVVERFEAVSDLDLWLCRYGSKAAFDPTAREVKPSLQQVISFGSSNTLVLRGALLSAIGGFDETLGLGTPAKSGEDTEFGIRAHIGARRSEFADARMVGHRDSSPDIRAKYYAGSLTAIARHARTSPAGGVALIRKLLVGVVLTFRRHISVSDMKNHFRKARHLIS
jgi:hypothetical protein